MRRGSLVLHTLPTPPAMLHFRAEDAYKPWLGRFLVLHGGDLGLRGTLARVPYLFQVIAGKSSPTDPKKIVEIKIKYTRKTLVDGVFEPEEDPDTNHELWTLGKYAAHNNIVPRPGERLTNLILRFSSDCCSTCSSHPSVLGVLYRPRCCSRRRRRRRQSRRRRYQRPRSQRLRRRPRGVRGAAGIVFRIIRPRFGAPYYLWRVQRDPQPQRRRVVAARSAPKLSVFSIFLCHKTRACTLLFRAPPWRRTCTQRT